MSDFTPLTNGLKTYDHVQIGDIDDRKVIRKPITAIEREFFELARNNSALCDVAVLPYDVDEEYAYYDFIEGGDIISQPIDYWRKTVAAIAKLSAIELIPTKLIPCACKLDYIDRIIEVRELAEKMSVALSRDNFGFMLKQAERLTFTSYCHEDLIALNILRDGEQIRIVDWEHIRIDFHEKDLGRLLGDLYFKDPSAGKYYYPAEWRQELINLYVTEVKRRKPSYDEHVARANLRFAMLWNYLGPIRGILSSGKDLNSAWFKANVEEFNRS